MKQKLWKSKNSVLFTTQTLLLLVAVIIPVAQWNANASTQWSDELQQLKAHKLWLVRALNMLKEHRPIAQTLSISTDAGFGNHVESVDSITLSLIDAIKQQARAEQVELTQLSVTQSDDWPTVPVASDLSQSGSSSLHTLTVEFAVTTDRAMTLLSHFSALSDAAKWRPIEVRGCSVVRLTELPVSLHAACAVDIYYFPEVHNFHKVRQ